MTTARRRPAAVAALVAAALALSGCTYFTPPDPPDVVEKYAEQALTGIRSLPGIGQADADISPKNGSSGGPALDDPLEWIVRITVSTRGEPDLLRVATAVETELDTLRTTVPAIAYLSDERQGQASAQLELGPVLDDPTIVAQTVDAATALRTVPTLDSLWVSTYSDPVRADVLSPDDWTASVAGIRALPGFGAPGMESATITTFRAGRHGSLAFDPVSPAEGVTEALVDIVDLPDVTSLRFEGVRSASEMAQVWRPRLTIDTTSASTARDVADSLAALPGAPPAGTPRTGFQIWVQSSANAEGVSGFVGLPLRSPEPLDALPVPVVEPPPIDPVVAAAQLEADRLLIDELFAEAGTVAGIAGTSTVETIPCDSGWGEHVQGRTLIPVFEIGDSADAPFAAIVAAWGDRGFEYADRAMGTDFYASADLERLSIRGGVDGISVTALGLCTG